MGKRITRRALLAFMGTTILWRLQPLLSALAHNSADSLNLHNRFPVTPEQEQGPFYIEKQLLRSNIREDRPGVPLELSIFLIDSLSGKPLKDAAVDIWHCDSEGSYSGFAQMAELVPRRLDPVTSITLLLGIHLTVRIPIYLHSR